MAYNENNHRRIEEIVSKWKKTAHKKMFGGVCHLLDGNMFCGVLNNDLIVRLGEKNAKAALAMRHVKPFDITGKPMKAWVMVASKGFESDDDLKKWLFKARDFVRTLPGK